MCAVAYHCTTYTKKPKVRVIYGIVIYEGYFSKEILHGFKCLGA